jgi:glucosamine--fructose-6-phosphate aminotransferase (isomerizing)
MASLVDTEIAEQPDVVARLLERERAAIARVAADARRRHVRFALIAARGTSDNAARYAQHVLGRFARLPVALATPSLHTVYAAPPRLRDVLVIGISQSGASPDVVAVLEDAARAGQLTLAVTNDPGSPLAAAAEHVVALRTGPERAVAATKTYTASLAALAALAAELAGEDALRRELAGAPELVARQLALQEGLDAAVEAAADWDRCSVLGRGPCFATAHEVALKVKELTGTAAEPYSPPDFLHGPVATLEAAVPAIVVAPSGPTLAGQRELLRTIRERGAPALALADEPEVAAEATLALPLVRAPEWLSALTTVVPGQRLAVALARRRGLDADQPPTLTKVTRTR